MRLTTIEQNNAISTVSKNYSFISSKNIINTLSDEGWNLRQHSDRKTRKLEKRGFQYHVMRFSNKNEFFKIGNDLIEIIISNSHDGTSSLKLSLGVFRIVCSNGLTSGKSISDVRILHRNVNVETIVRAINDLTSQANKLKSIIDTLKNTYVSPSKKEILLSKIYQGDDSRDWSFRNVVPLRSEDIGYDAWKILNVIQEHAMKGGVEYKSGVSFKKTRKITSLKRQEYINNKIINTFIDVLQIAV